MSKPSPAKVLEDVKEASRRLHELTKVRRRNESRAFEIQRLQSLRKRIQSKLPPLRLVKP